MKRALRGSWLVLAALCVGMLLFGVFAVPRLVNPIWSDTQFTGWVAPIAHRMVLGDHIYADFTLPNSPASYALLAVVQKLLSRYRLVDELWVCFACQVGMCLVGYAMLRPLTSRMNAALAAAAAAPMLIATPKEIAYDSTALLVAWGMLAALSAALTATGRTRQAVLAALAGTLATFCLAFKSSTAAGACAGLMAAIALAWIAAFRSGRLQATRPVTRTAVFAAAGALFGMLLCVLLLIPLGAPLGEFVQAVLIDGPQLKGTAHRGPSFMFSFVAMQRPAQLSLLMAVVVALVVVRVGKIGDVVRLDGPPERDAEADRGGAALRHAGWAALSVIVVFALGALGLALQADSSATTTGLTIAAGAGLSLFTMGLLALPVAILANAGVSCAPNDRSIAFAAVALGAGTVSLFQNLSHPLHMPLAHNNPIIPLCALLVLVAFERAGSARLRGIVFVVLLLTLYGEKFRTYLAARHEVEDPGFWAGLRVSDNGKKILNIALHARSVAGEHGSLLMLPEDPMVEALIGRPRPPLRAAIVFPDQFPQRLLARDRQVLLDNLPEVIIIHPNEQGWLAEFNRAWSQNPASTQLQQECVQQVLAEQYTLESSYPTRFFVWDADLQIFVRKR